MNMQDNQAIEIKQQQECPPPLANCEIPTVCSDYECKIPNEIREEIQANFKSQKLVADNVYAEAEQKADDIKAEAESKHSLAIAKYNSAKKLQCTKTENAKEEVCASYEKCLKDLKPKNCTSVDNIPQDKKAICIVKLELELSKKDQEFISEMQKVEQAKSEAKAEWLKSENAYNIAIRLAEAEKDQAYKTAEVELRKALSEALESTC